MHDGQALSNVICIFELAAFENKRPFEDKALLVHTVLGDPKALELYRKPLPSPKHCMTIFDARARGLYAVKGIIFFDKRARSKSVGLMLTYTGCYIDLLRELKSFKDPLENIERTEL